MNFSKSIAWTEEALAGFKLGVKRVLITLPRPSSEMRPYYLVWLKYTVRVELARRGLARLDTSGGDLRQMLPRMLARI